MLLLFATLTRRRRGAVTPRHCVPSVTSREAVWGAHAVGRGRLGERSFASRADRFEAYGFAPSPSSPTAPPPASRVRVWAWCVLFRVTAPTSPSVVAFGSSPTSRALQHAGYLCSWCLLAPLRVTVVAALLPGRPWAASLSYPSGTHNTWQPNTNSEVTSAQHTVSIRVRVAVDERACLAALGHAQLASLAERSVQSLRLCSESLRSVMAG